MNGNGDNGVVEGPTTSAGLVERHLGGRKESRLYSQLMRHAKLIDAAHVRRDRPAFDRHRAHMTEVLDRHIEQASGV